MLKYKRPNTPKPIKPRSTVSKLTSQRSVNQKPTKPKVKAQVGKKIKIKNYESTKANIINVIEAAKFSKKNLKREIGHLTVNDFFGGVRNTRNHVFFSVFGNMKMDHFIDIHENKFMQFVKKEIYK